MYQQRLPIFRQLGARHGKGMTLVNMGVLPERQGKADEAVALWRQALELLHPESPEHAQVKGLLEEAGRPPT